MLLKVVLHTINIKIKGTTRIRGENGVKMVDLSVVVSTPAWCTDGLNFLAATDCK
jgi:hypothetical protein